MSFFKKLFSKKFQDESFEDQKNEVETDNLELEKITGLKANSLKEGCDQIACANGAFGHDAENPIPVNGIKGEIKYLNRIRCECGVGLIFHRAGSASAKNNDNAVDVYETVCMNGKHWDTLYLDMYYLRRSTLLPAHYTFSDFHPLFSKVPFGFGIHNKCDNFPVGIPRLLAEQIGGTLGLSFAEKLKKVIGDGSKFKR